MENLSIHEQALRNGGEIQVKDDGTVLNEEGLPFLEIREDLPNASASLHSGFASATIKDPIAHVTPITPDEKDDYWSAEAIERRRKLKERLFAGSDDDEEEEEEEEEVQDGAGEDEDEDRGESPNGDREETGAANGKPSPKGFMLRSREIVHTKPENADGLVAAQTSATNLDPPKPPRKRKSNKGVSFATHAAVRHFDKEEALLPDAAPAPIGSVENEVAKAIEGVGTSQKAASATEFSGFKRGFLNAPKTPTKPPPNQSASKETLEPIQPPHEPSPPAPKRQSLFAQREAQSSRQAASPSDAGPVIKSAVVERAPPSRPAPSAPAAPAKLQPPDSDEEINEDAYYSDDSASFDITDAMLAREAAIAYHQKRAELGRRGLGGWTGSVRHKESVGPVDRDSDDEMFGDDDEEWWQDEDGRQVESGASRSAVGFGERVVPHAFMGEDGSVSLPQVVPGEQGLGAIKIGKLENGNLVVRDEDDSEDDLQSADAERRQAAENKRRMLDRLKSEDPVEMIKEEEREKDRREEVAAADEPPRAREQPPAIEPPKRVSKFKAARLAQRQ